MTSMQILTILMSMSFAVAFTAVLRKLLTKPDGTCPIDGKWVYISAAVFGVAGKVLSHYAASIPPIVWEVMEPLIGVVLAVGGVQALTGKKVANVVNISTPKIIGTDGSPIDKAKLGLGALMLIGAAIVLSQVSACWAAAPACKVVDAVHDTCVVFSYLGPNGQKETVVLNREEAADMAMHLHAKRAAAIPVPPPTAGLKPTAAPTLPATSDAGTDR